MHMKLYNALCENEKLRECLPEIINNLLENPEESQKHLKKQSKERRDSLTSHALRILANLSEKGNTAILTQLRDGASRLDIKDSVEGFILQVMVSDRWLKHDQKNAYDLIIAIPDLSKIIAISTTEAEIPMNPIIPRLSKVNLEHAHLYTFFNRAHAVKGRKVTSTDISAENMIGAKQLKPFMRTCDDIQAIGNGRHLSFFTPFFTCDGLKLGFFFVLIGKVNSVEPVRSPTGYGVSMDQVDLVLNDFSGCLKARLSNEVFLESLENPLQRKNLNIQDPDELKNVSEPLLIVGVWILGLDYPEILFIGTPEDSLGVDVWGLLSFMNTQRKTAYDKLVSMFTEKVVEKTLNVAGNLVRIKDIVYYKETGWPTELFLSMEDTGFPYRLSFPDALKFGASFWIYRFWSNRILRFLRVNPHIMARYRSKLSDEDYPTANKTLNREIQTAQFMPTVIHKTKVCVPVVKVNAHRTEKGIKCPICGLDAVIREVSSEDGYYVEFCQGSVTGNAQKGNESKEPCKYWNSGWIAKKNT